MGGVSFDEVNKSSAENSCRRTSTKFCISGEYNVKEGVVFKKGKYGEFKIEWKGRIPIKTEDYERCDLGHKHKIYKDEKWVWNYASISASDAKTIAAFLLGE